MPCIYAHDRFGRLVYADLKGDVKAIIQKYYRQFQIGLQGPDIFFFHKVYFGGNKVTRYGTALHEASAYALFEHALQVIEKTGKDSPEYAYILGVVGHFSLDSEAHHYVNALIEETGMQHIEIEEEFDKMLLRMDDQNPFTYPLQELVPTDFYTAQAIEPFYADFIDVAIVQRALKDMKFIKTFFYAPNDLKYHAISGLMKCTLTYYPYVKGYMHQRKDHPNASISNEVLLQRFNGAISVCETLIYAFDQAVDVGCALPKRFDRNFE